MRILLLAAIAAIFTSSCSEPAQENKRISKKLEHEESVENTVVSDSTDLRIVADKIVQILDDGNYGQLHQYIPEEGLLFSPYTYLDSATVVLQKDSLSSALKKGSKIMWGHTDGKGDSILLSVAEFLETYLYDTNYVHADTVSIGEFVGSGNTLNNIKKRFSAAKVVEYHFFGSEKYSKMDWQSLILVFDKRENRYFLRALISNEWTV